MEMARPSPYLWASDLPKPGEWINGSNPFTAIRYPYLDLPFVCKNVVPDFFTPKKEPTKFGRNFTRCARRSRYLYHFLKGFYLSTPTSKMTKNNSNFCTNHSTPYRKLVKTWMPMEAPKEFHHGKTREKLGTFSQQRIGVPNHMGFGWMNPVFHRGVFLGPRNFRH